VPSQARLRVREPHGQRGTTLSEPLQAAAAAAYPEKQPGAVGEHGDRGRVLFPRNHACQEYMIRRQAPQHR